MNGSAKYLEQYCNCSRGGCWKGTHVADLYRSRQATLVHHDVSKRSCIFAVTFCDGTCQEKCIRCRFQSVSNTCIYHKYSCQDKIYTPVHSIVLLSSECSGDIFNPVINSSNYLTIARRSIMRYHSTIMQTPDP